MRDGQTIAANAINKGEQVTVTFTTKPGSSLRHVSQVQIGKGSAEKDDATADKPKKPKKKS